VVERNIAKAAEEKGKQVQKGNVKESKKGKGTSKHMAQRKHY
jgi:hypothetical protein